MGRIAVTHRVGLSFDVSVRGYRVISEEPVALGGEGEGVTPTELVVAGLAACTAEVATRRLAELGLRHEPVEVSANFDWDRQRERVSRIVIVIAIPAAVGAASREAVLEALLKCPARVLLTEPPSVDYEMTVGGRPVPMGIAVGTSHGEA